MVFFTTGATTKNRPGNPSICTKKVSQMWEGTSLVQWSSLGADLLSKPFKMYTYTLSLRIERWGNRDTTFFDEPVLH